MKTLKLILISVTALLLLTSCNDDETCRTVTGTSLMYGNVDKYYLIFDHEPLEVSYQDYKSYGIGSTYCE